MSILSVKNLSAGYQKKNIINDISFNIEKGKIVGVIGANGSGKTTLLKAVANLLPHEGLCSINQKPINEMSQKELALCCGYIPQKSSTVMGLSILDVVMMGYNPKLNLLQHPTRAMKDDAINIMTTLGIFNDKISDITPYTSFLDLSEGQKQLCILARTLVYDKSLLLLDEPESALDFKMRYRVLELLKKYVTTHDAGVLISLHDSALALNYCDELLVLDNKKLIGQIHPQKDTIEQMESILTHVYGSVSLYKIKDRNNLEKIVMIKESFDN